MTAYEPSLHQKLLLEAVEISSQNKQFKKAPEISSPVSKKKKIVKHFYYTCKIINQQKITGGRGSKM